MLWPRFGSINVRDDGTNMENREIAFALNASSVKYGAGVLSELGSDAAALGLKRIAFFTDPTVAATEPAALALDALRREGIDVALFEDCHVEPTNTSMMAAAAFVSEGGFDGVVSLGGGSVIDTAKVANLCATGGAEILSYVTQPLGQGTPIPGPLMPHIACPTTSGTGAEISANAAFQYVERCVKTGISSKFLRPNLALVDPDTTKTLPGGVIAATGFDVLTNAVESYVARPFTSRERPASPQLRPPYQGANPYSDIGARETLRMLGRYLIRAIKDAGDREARHMMMFAATYSRLASGSAGVHIPHAMSYSVAGLNHTFVAEGYQDADPMVPHGIAVVVNAPAAFRFTAPAAPEKHLESAALLGADVQGAAPQDAGDVLAEKLVVMMRQAGVPNGVGALGYGPADIPALAEGAHAQQRLLILAPRQPSQAELADIYGDAMTYW